MSGTVLQVYTVVHVVISLVAIASGFVVAHGLLTSKRLECWTAIFLAFTAGTSVTGFFFPFGGFTPAIGTGIVTLLVLPVACYARYGRHLAGHWRWIYAIAALFVLYLNVLVLVVQSFAHVPALHALAPTQTEPAFTVAQGAVFVGFIVLGVFAVRNRRLPTADTAPARRVEIV